MTEPTDHHDDHRHPDHDFDARAETWDDDPAKVERAAVVAERIVAAVAPERTTRLLEYGAGTGLVTEALQPHVGPVTLADPSAGMRAVIEEKIARGALSDARVWSLDLATDPVPDDRFDLVVTVLALHHIPEVDVVLGRFGELLAPDGHLCVVDFDEEDGSFHGEGFTGHHGFDRSRMGELLRDAGFTAITFADCHHVERDGRDFPLFLATARRPAT